MSEAKDRAAPATAAAESEWAAWRDLMHRRIAEAEAHARRRELQLAAYRESDRQRAAAAAERRDLRRAYPLAAWLVTALAAAWLAVDVGVFGRVPGANDLLSGAVLYCTAFAWGMAQEEGDHG
jgi:hypothetical protein